MYPSTIVVERPILLSLERSQSFRLWWRRRWRLVGPQSPDYDPTLVISERLEIEKYINYEPDKSVSLSRLALSEAIIALTTIKSWQTMSWKEYVNHQIRPPSVRSVQLALDERSKTVDRLKLKYVNYHSRPSVSLRRLALDEHSKIASVWKTQTGNTSI